MVLTGVSHAIETSPPELMTPEDVKIMKALILEAYRYIMSYKGTDPNLLDGFSALKSGINAWNLFYPELHEELAKAP